MELAKVYSLCTLIRYYILQSTTTAGSGHPSSALSAVELIATLFFRHFYANLDIPFDSANDRFILSKGHASPLLYAIYTALGKLSFEDLLTLRKFKSPIEGHPSMRFAYTEVPTGSLGQGLSTAVGMALALKKMHEVSNKKQEIQLLISENQQPTNNNVPFIYVLLGDGEMAEGQVWEAIQLASYYKLANIIGIVDVNGYGQNQETMTGQDISMYAKRISAFGWRVYEVADGHNLSQIDAALEKAKNENNTNFMPAMLIAKTIKGKGVSLMEGKANWHGKTLTKDELNQALKELDTVDTLLRGEIAKPKNYQLSIGSGQLDAIEPTTYNQKLTAETVATRVAYGEALSTLVKEKANVLVLDAELRMSTGSETVRKAFPDRFIEMFIAEQNMVSAAFGLAKYGFVPYISTFGSFFTRAFDQLRMGAFSGLHIIVGASHNGVTVGSDGPSQMGLEDLALFRSLFGSTVLYPADAIATRALVSEAYHQKGIVYIRTGRNAVPKVYKDTEQFPIGGSKVFPATISISSKKYVTVIAAGATLFEAFEAKKQLEAHGIPICVIDCYSIKPLDTGTLTTVASESMAIIVVEDHYAQGGLGEAVSAVISSLRHPPLIHLAVKRMPMSGSSQELLDYEGIASGDITETVTSFWQTYESNSV